MLYDYTQLKEDLTKLKDTSLNRIDQLDGMFDILLEHSTLLAREVGRLKGYCLLLETAKGRQEQNMDAARMEEIFAAKAEAEQWLKVIDDVYFITNQKVKILSKINPNE